MATDSLEGCMMTEYFVGFSVSIRKTILVMSTPLVLIITHFWLP